jgi:hypothetical protein
VGNNGGANRINAVSLPMHVSQQFTCEFCRKQVMVIARVLAGVAAARVMQQGSSEQDFHICPFCLADCLAHAVNALDVTEAVHFIAGIVPLAGVLKR